MVTAAVPLRKYKCWKTGEKWNSVLRLPGNIKHLNLNNRRVDFSIVSWEIEVLNSNYILRRFELDFLLKKELPS